MIEVVECPRPQSLELQEGSEVDLICSGMIITGANARTSISILNAVRAHDRV